MTNDDVVKALEKKGKSGAKDIGTDQKTMEALEAAGVVRRNGHISTGKRGRPPIAWELVDASKVDQVEVVTRTKRDASDMTPAWEGKARAREKREKEEKQNRARELKELKSVLPTLEPDYDKALALAVKATEPKEIVKRFNRADQIQNDILGTVRRIRVLEAA